MDTLNKTRIMTGIVHAQTEAHQSSIRFGYWDKKRSPEELVAQLHKEVSGLFETAVIGDGPSHHFPDTTIMEERLADIIIRALDVGAGLQLSVGPALLTKLEYNERLSKLARGSF